MAATIRRPHDRLKTEHLGVVERVIWHDPTAGRVIVGLNDGFAAVGSGLADQFPIGQRVRFLGRWKDSQRGYQFAFDTFILDLPSSRKGQIDYLIEYAPNVGKATAEKLCDKYGSEAVRTLRERPELVADDGLMTPISAAEASIELKKHERLERTKIDLFELFKGRGFPGKLVDLAIKKWGAKAPSVIRRNPFTLLVHDMPGAGFKRCDRMWCELGKPKNSLKRQMLAGWNAIRESSDGHTWCRGEQFVDAVKVAIPGTTDPKRAIRLGLRAGWIRKHRDADNVLWLAESEKAIAEIRVADRVTSLRSGPVLWPQDLPVSQTDGDGLPSQHQHDIAMRVMSSPVAILAGGPGTGKTHLLAFILKSIIQTHGIGSVAVCAPTGKAAVRASQSLARLGLPIKAKTIHRLLSVGRSGTDGKGWGFVSNRDNPLTYQFVIVDESSMIDTTLMADLLDATIDPHWIPPQAEEVIDEGKIIPPACRRCGRRLTDPDSWEIGYGPECRKHVSEGEWEPVEPVQATRRVVLPAMPSAVTPGTHILLIGDPHQLPPVGHGAPLRDLMASGRVACGELTEIRRNAGLIVEGCRDIREGKPFATASEWDGDKRNLVVIAAKDEAKQMDALRDVLESDSPFDRVWETQILVGLNKKGRLAREYVNDMVRAWLNPQSGDLPQFAPNDKIICLRNARVFPYIADPGRIEFDLPIEGPRHYIQVGDVQEFLANGETGRVLCVDHQWAVVRFREDQPDDELVTKIWLPKSKSKDNPHFTGDDDAATSSAFDLAYAVTTHKCQGSEAKRVIILADPSAGMVASREWWYTAISRASQLCIIIGKPETVYQQCRRESLDKRKTFLVETLTESGVPL